MPLSVPLNQAQIDAANRLQAQLFQWRTTDTALDFLHANLPANDATSCLVKSVAINALYGTNILAIIPVAAHVAAVLKQHDREDGIELVEVLGSPVIPNAKTQRRTVSFSSKFCHFFIDAEKFPIFDEAARCTLELHLGLSKALRDRRRPYIQFCEQFRSVREEAAIRCTTRQFDRYLWLTGVYAKWLIERRKKKPAINAELRALFTSPSREQSTILDAMLPTALERVCNEQM